MSETEIGKLCKKEQLVAWVMNLITEDDVEPQGKYSAVVFSKKQEGIGFEWLVCKMLDTGLEDMDFEQKDTTKTQTTVAFKTSLKQKELPNTIE